MLAVSDFSNGNTLKNCTWQKKKERKELGSQPSKPHNNKNALVLKRRALKDYSNIQNFRQRMVAGGRRHV